MKKVTALFILWVLIPLSVAAAPKAELWSKWQAHDAASTTVVDHGKWNDFLSRYVSTSSDGINRVAYARVSAADVEQLRIYRRALGDIAVSNLNRSEQRAYWINLYNALTLSVVLDNYPVSSIRKINISPGFFSSGPWGKKLITIEGEKVSLDDIEHRIVRPIWKDPRLHYALNCASIGCPNLQGEAFSANNSEALLEKAAREYINHPRGARVEKKQLKVSSIYSWFKEDFGGTDGAVIGHLKAFAAPKLKQFLMGIDDIDDDDYNWSLNE
jgi:hypothetical protein